MDQPIINLNWDKHKHRLAREKALVARICALPDRQQLQVLAFIEHLGLGIKVEGKKPIEYE